MVAIEFSALMAIAALLALGSLVHSARVAVPAWADLRSALRDCPETIELRYTLREVVVRHNDGKVVPLRPRAVSLPRPLPQREAA